MAKNEPDQNDDKPMNAYGKYSALGFQMVVTVGLLSYAGYRIDEAAGHKVKWVTAVMSLVAIGASLYILIVSLKK